MADGTHATITDEERLEFADKLQYWDQLRNAIIHEDNLVNHRLTWILSIEGFLVAGFFVVQAAILTSNHALDKVAIIEWGLAGIFLAACVICYSIGSMIAAAYKQISIIRAAWINKYSQEMYSDDWRKLHTLPKRFWKDTRPKNVYAIPTPAAGEDSNGGPELPPIIGEFDIPSLARPQLIALFLIVLNIIACAGCYGIYCVTATSQKSEQPAATAVSEKASSESAP